MQPYMYLAGLNYQASHDHGQKVLCVHTQPCPVRRPTWLRRLSWVYPTPDHFKTLKIYPFSFSLTRATHTTGNYSTHFH